MIENETSNNIKKNINYYININFKNRNHLMIIEFETIVSELKEKIYNYFKIDEKRYDLYYKNVKINSNDNRPIALLFQNEIEKYPLLFIINKRKEKCFSSMKPIYSITINSNIPIKKFTQILNKFFEYKNCPNNAIIKNNIKGIYEIKFRKSIFATEFKQYFDVNYNKKFKEDRIILPPINNNNESKNINIKDDEIIYHNRLNKKSKSINYKKEKNDMIMPFKYINSDDKYFCDKIIDTKNWLYKNGFINNTNKYNLNNNYFIIENYVGATPNIPPVLHNFRDVSKNNWIDQRGFYP
jgi:hypothetical protein